MIMVLITELPMLVEQKTKQIMWPTSTSFDVITLSKPTLKLSWVIMGDDIGSGLVTDCRLRSDSDLLSSTKLSYGKNQNKPFYRF